MSSSEFGVPEPSRPSIPEPAESLSESPAESNADQPPEEEVLLERVLRETAALAECEEPVDDEEMEALEQVARRLKGQSFAMNPVVVELVRAMLLVQFGRQWNSPALWEVVSRRIAATLFEDPTSRARFETLWTRLSESPP